jgi:hypothetical protein
MTEETVRYGVTGLPYYVTRTDVKGGDESLEYEDGGKKDDKDARKENDNRNAKKDLKFAHPPTTTPQYISGGVIRRELS